MMFYIQNMNYVMKFLFGLKRKHGGIIIQNLKMSICVWVNIFPNIPRKYKWKFKALKNLLFLKELLGLKLGKVAVLLQKSTDGYIIQIKSGGNAVWERVLVCLQWQEINTKNFCLCLRIGATKITEKITINCYVFIRNTTYNKTNDWF